LELGEISAIREDIDAKYKKILQFESTLEAFREKVNKVSTDNASLKTKLSELEKTQTRTESDIQSSRDVVTWVTLIVTIVVILIGLFFSKQFLDLYANYKVLADRAKRNSQENSRADTANSTDP
jgi:hypothetical protein